MTGRELCSPPPLNLRRTMMVWPVCLQMSLMLMLVSSPPYRSPRADSNFSTPRYSKTLMQTMQDTHPPPDRHYVIDTVSES